MSNQVSCHITDQIRIDVGDGTTVIVAASDVIEAIKLVTEMRLENKVEHVCRAILGGQKKLFGE